GADHEKPIGADDDAGDKIGNDGRQSEPPCDRDAQHGGGKKDEAKREEAKFGVLHGRVRAAAGPRATECARAGEADHLLAWTRLRLRASLTWIRCGVARARGRSTTRVRLGL